MSKLLDGLYLCPITGQNVQVLDERVECPEIKDSGDCKHENFLLNMIGCSVYVDANRAYTLSQPSAQRVGIQQSK